MDSQIVKAGGKEYKIYVRDEADRSVAAEIFKLKEYRVADETIKKAKGAVIDAGAHSGMFVLYARSFNPKVKILAVEPEPENLKLLARHLTENEIADVEIAAGALGGKTGKGRLLVSEDSHAHRLAGAGVSAQKTIPVAVYAPEDLLKKFKIKKISLLKMDIEGGEYAVFEEFPAALLGRIEAVVMEYHNAGRNHYRELENKLRENGFGVRIFPSKFDRRLGFIFAVNKRKL